MINDFLAGLAIGIVIESLSEIGLIVLNIISYLYRHWNKRRRKKMSNGSFLAGIAVGIIICCLSQLCSRFR